MWASQYEVQEMDEVPDPLDHSLPLTKGADQQQHEEQHGLSGTEDLDPPEETGGSGTDTG